MLQKGNYGFTEIEELVRKQFMGIPMENSHDDRWHIRKQFFERDSINYLPEISKIVINGWGYTQRELTADGLVSRRRILITMSFTDGRMDMEFALHGLKEMIGKEYLNQNLKISKIIVFGIGTAFTLIGILLAYFVDASTPPVATYSEDLFLLG